MNKSRVEPTIFFIEKISLSLKLSLVIFMGNPSLRLSEVLCYLMHLNGKISEKLIFLKTVDALVIILI